MRGDRRRLEQALAQLVGNAVKFTASGEVWVEVALEVLPEVLPEDAARDGLRLRFEVSDTGIGIPADQLERIFQPFTQVDSSMSRRFEGIGLGLAIARRLAEVLGGRITVESTEGKGSKFSLSARFASGLPALNFAGGPAPAAPCSAAPEPCSTPTEPCSAVSEPCSAAT